MVFEFGEEMTQPQAVYTVVTNTTPVTVPQLFDAVGEEIVARWQTLGITDDKIQWQYGEECDALIPEFAPMLVYKAIAIATGKTSQTIRKAYATYKCYTKEQREKYNLVPYSVFAHARMLDNKESILDYYMEHQSTPDEIEEKYPVVANPEIESEFNRYGIDRIFYSIFREVFGLDVISKSQVIEHIKGIQRIIREANQVTK